ncbi:hypothetical protein BaRGS_00037402 [Batillaria attramentaria]|uniref:Uncharacterized protein n=1 Tax=Batillaria attramentaria TaxID=370345 RepID=A0ABD0J944_9CAEN
MTDRERRAQAKELNDFYCRFDSLDFTENRKQMCDTLSDVASSEDIPEIHKETVEAVFRGLNPRKAPGPDNISGRLTKTCSEELSGVFCSILNL